MDLSIRWRLTLWFSLIFLVILIITGFFLNTLLRTYLLNDIDKNLQNYSARVHGTLHANNNGPLDFNIIHSSLPPINEFSSPGIYIQIIDAKGTAVIKSDNLANQELPFSQLLSQAAIAGNIDIFTLAADNTSVRIMVSPLYTIDQTLILEVAQSLKPVENTQQQFRLAFIGGAILALVLTAILGTLLIKRTLRPVEVITRTAKNIEESSDLERRVGYKGPDDEIGRLANTFDHMIERLDQTFSSQKYFIADASHELRTPLTVIKGNLDLLKRNISPEDREESLRAIEFETRRMITIAEDLLLLAEIESGHSLKHAPLSLKTLATEEIDRAQLLAGKRRVVSGRLEELSVTGDIVKLSQVLSNLVDNAIKYTPEEGSITLAVFRDGDWARLEVTDSGIGIGADDLSHVFDRFFRVDKARSRAVGGTGLGLAIVKGIVEQHGGKVTASSAPGMGSTFTVWLKIPDTF
jgi:two-component system OmpR family sensor kinase